MSRARPTLRLASATLLTALPLALPRPAAADKIGDLVAMVERKPDGMDRDEWREKRRETAKALGGAGDRRAVPALIKVVETEQFDVIGEIAIEALGKLGDKRAVPVLRTVLDDPSRDRFVRAAARKALRRIGGGAAAGGAEKETGNRQPGTGNREPGTGAGSGARVPGAGARARVPASGAAAPVSRARVSEAGSGAEGEAGGGEDLLGGEEAEAAPRGPTFDDDILGATERVTFALGGVRLEYDTVRKTPTLDGDASLTYERTRDQATRATRVALAAAVVAGVIDYDGAGLSSREALVTTRATAEARFYTASRPLYAVVGARLAPSLSAIKVNRAGGDNDTSDVRFGLDGEAAIGAGHGRVLDMGDALRVRRIEEALRRARALGRPITPDLAERLMSAWWALRGEQGAHRRLTATVAILREAGVLLGEPDASLSYQILQVLLDGQLDRRPSGLDFQLGIAESYLYREDSVPVEDGRIESVFAAARMGRQIGTGGAELVGEAGVRYRILPEEGDPEPWAAVAAAAWRRYFYGPYGDPIGALEVTGDVGASTDGLVDSEIGGRIAGGIAWLWSPNRASRFRLAGTGRYETGEIFLGAVFEARYGLLDATFIGSGAYSK